MNKAQAINWIDDFLKEGQKIKYKNWTEKLNG